MAGPKKAATKKATARPAATAKPTAKVASLQKRAARDPQLGPSSKRIEQSFREGSSVTLEYFRSKIDCA